MKDAPATAAEQAPNAVPESTSKMPVWLTMSEDDFAAYCKKLKYGGKKVEAMRERRAEFAGASDDDVGHGDKLEEDERAGLLPPPFDPSLSNEAQAAQPIAPKRKKTKAEVVQAAIALDKAPPEALRTRYIDPKMIDVQEGWNARFDFGDIEELAASIKARKALDGHGLINDLRVKEKPDGRYALVDGERRLHSVLHLIDKGEVFDFGIPAKVEPADAEDADLLIAMFTANMGKPFLPIEEAHYYDRLRKSGMTIAQIEAQTGRSDNTIVGCLALLEADDDLVEAVSAGKISGTMAKSIAVNVRGNKAKQKELVAKAKAAKNDPKAAKAVKKEIDDERKKKFAARTGKQAKGRFDALTPNELGELGTNVALTLKERIEREAGYKGSKVPESGDVAELTEWILGDRELQIAATFGALQALKAAAGVKIDLTFKPKG